MTDEAVGSVTTHTCGCGHCGLTFTVEHPLRGKRRKYSLECPLREKRALDQRRKASRIAYEKRRKKNPRRCFCGCGRELPRYVRFHPDCETREESGLGRKPTEPAKGRCGECYDQGWRRHRVLGCGRCGRAYEPEKERPRDVPMRSSLGSIIG